jgi:hypothetical protein
MTGIWFLNQANILFEINRRARLVPSSNPPTAVAMCGKKSYGTVFDFFMQFFRCDELTLLHSKIWSDP